MQEKIESKQGIDVNKDVKLSIEQPLNYSGIRIVQFSHFPSGGFS